MTSRKFKGTENLVDKVEMIDKVENRKAPGFLELLQCLVHHTKEGVVFS